MTDAAIAEIGDNLPKEVTAADALHERLVENFDDLTTRRDELLAAAERAPVIIDDEETAGKTTDFIRQISAAVKNAESTRVAEKEPFLVSSRTVDGFFRAITDPLKQAKTNITSVLTTYQRKVAEAERAARVEIERKAREEADEAVRKAEEAEEKAWNDAGLGNAIEAADAAEKAKADAAEAQKAADAKAADMSQTRGDYGGHASLRTSWVHDEAGLDRATLDLETLRAHIPLDALHKAVRSFIKAEGRELKGVRIYEQTKSVVR